MNRSLAMPERRQRTQRLEPAAPIPTRTTTLRRQVLVNIEAKGSSPSLRPRRRRKRELLMPYPYPFSPMSMPVDYAQLQQIHETKGDLHYGFVDPLESMLLYSHLGYPMMRMNSGQEYDMMYAHTTNVNSSGEQNSSIDELRCIAGTLEGSLHNFLANKSETVHNCASDSHYESTKTDNYVSIGPQMSKMHILTDMMCDTIYRLNSFISSQTQIEEKKSPYITPPSLPSQPQPTYNMGLGSEGLKSYSHQLHPSNVMTANNDSRLRPVESTEATTQTKSRAVRMPWLPERRRKRLVKPIYIHLQNQGCSTEDLDMWQSNSRENQFQTQHFSQQSSSKSMKDSGTTMWCPMECCRGYCEYVGLGKSCGNPTYPKRNEVDSRRAKDEYEVDSKSVSMSNADSQTTIYSTNMTSSSTSDIRSEAGVQNTQLTYSYIEEQREEQPKRTDSSDDWYRSASKSLAVLEEEENYFKAMAERRQKLSTRNKRLQTEPVPTSASSEASVNVRANAERAVSTNNLNACRLKKPVNSAAKTRHVKTEQENVDNTAAGFDRLTKVNFEQKVPSKLQDTMGKLNTRALGTNHPTPKGFEIKMKSLNETPINGQKPPKRRPSIKRKKYNDTQTKKKRTTKVFNCSPLISPPPSIRKSVPCPTEC